MTATELAGAIASIRELHPQTVKLDISVLSEILVIGANLEAARIARDLRALFERDCPAIAKLAAGPWVKKVERILQGQAAYTNEVKHGR